jgi:hypothetical protein
MVEDAQAQAGTITAGSMTIEDRNILEGTRKHLVQRRNRLFAELRTRDEAWIEMTEICQNIYGIDLALGRVLPREESPNAEIPRAA